MDAGTHSAERGERKREGRKDEKRTDGAIQRKRERVKAKEVRQDLLTDEELCAPTHLSFTVG